jgi:hypothetical protein
MSSGFSALSVGVSRRAPDAVVPLGEYFVSRALPGISDNMTLFALFGIFLLPEMALWCREGARKLTRFRPGMSGNEIPAKLNRLNQSFLKTPAQCARQSI